MLPPLCAPHAPAGLEAVEPPLLVELVLLGRAGERPQAKELLNLGQLLPRAEGKVVGVENLSQTAAL